MSVNIKKNGTLTKLAGLYSDINLRLSQLLDTDISSLEDGQILAYNDETEKWENQEAPAGVEVVDNLTTQSATSALSANQGYVLNNALAGKANAADVLPTLITSPANKQILSYDSSSSKWVNTVNGNTVFLGTADPAANLGKEGDFYVKLSSPSYGNSYRIHTKSTGGETASIDVDTITDGAVVATQNINYHWPAQTFPDFSTNYKSSNWSVTITSDNVYGRAKGSTISWPYFQTNDVTLTINPPSVYGIFVKSRGIWIQIGKSPVENFAELKDTNFNNLQDGQLAVYNNTTGKWENQTPNYNDLFIIALTPTQDPETENFVFSADKTPSEVLTAIHAGKTIMGVSTFEESEMAEIFYFSVGSIYTTASGGIDLILKDSFYTGDGDEGSLNMYTIGLSKSESTQEDVWETIDFIHDEIDTRTPIIKFPIDEDEGVYSMDQDFQEFLDAYYSHQNIFLTCNGQEYAYEKYDSSTHTFYFTSTLADSIKTFVLVGNSSTGEWTSITFEETSMNSTPSMLTLTISQDEQTGDLVCDKLPSEVEAAYNNGAILQIKALVGEELTLSLIYTQDMSFFFGATVLAAETGGIASVGVNLLKDSSNDTWESIDFYDEHVTEPKIATISKNGNIYSCDLTPDEIDDAIEYDAGVVLHYSENGVIYNFTLIGYEDTYVFASIIPTDTTNATVKMFSLGSNEFSLEQTATTSTSANTVYTFTDAKITANSTVDVYTNIFGVSPSNVVLADGSCTVTFPAQSSAQSMTCKIYVK